MSEPSVQTVQAEADAAFRRHLVDKATAARFRYGLLIDTETILRMLGDDQVVRWPTSVVLDAGPLQPHEFAYPQPLGFHPSDGYALCLHPAFRRQHEIWPLLIAYHIPVINYGPIVEAVHAELYGATLLGLEVEAYYQALCELHDASVADTSLPTA